MASHSSMETKRQRRVFPLYVNILTIFLAIVLAIAGGLTYYNYQSGKERAIMAARRMMSDIVANVEKRAFAMVGLDYSLVRMISHSPLLAVAPTRSDQPMKSFFLEALQSNPQVFGIFIGYDTGEFFQAVRLAHIPAEKWQGFKLPPGTVYGVRTVTNAKGGGREEAWQFLDRSLKVIETRVLPKATYDPRNRPWFKMAPKPGPPQMTDYYIFNEAQEPGLSIVKRFQDKPGGVLGVDVTARSLCDFVASQKIADSGMTLIFEEGGNIVAYPQVDEMVKTVEKDGKIYKTLATLQEVKSPLARALAANYKKNLRRPMAGS